MPKSTHRPKHKKKLLIYKKLKLDQKRLEKKRQKDMIEKMQQEYINQQQLAEQNADQQKDETLLSEAGEFKLDE